MATPNTKRPYLGLTGTKLNVWVSVACITAMTLFGESFVHAADDLEVLNTDPTGYDQGVFGGIIVTDDFLRQMGYPNANLQGTIVSLYDIGWWAP